MILRILHISDLHARPEREADIRIVLNAFRECLTNTLSQSGWQIDLVCFTGDLANKGVMQEYEFAQTVFLDPLLELLHLDKTRLFLVPGNHDVQRVLSGPELDHENQLLASLTSRDAVNRLLDTPADRVRAFGRLNAYKSFTAGYLNCLPASEDPTYACVRTTPVCGIDLGVASLNSAWRCNSDQDHRRLLIGERQVDTAGARIRQSALRISLVHHPFGWLTEFDERDCGRRTLAESDLILSGHVHDPLPVVTQTPHGHCLFSSAGALFDGRKFNGFSIIEIDPESFEGTAFLYRYYDDRRAFDKDLLIVADGTFRFQLGRSPTQSQRQRTPGEPRPDAETVLLDDAKKRERVTAAFKEVRHHVAGAWVLGVAIGVVDHAPPLSGTGTLVPVSLTRLSVSDSVISGLLRDLWAIGFDIRETNEDIHVLAGRLVSLRETAMHLWPAETHGLFSQFDRVVETLVQPNTSAQDVLPAKLLAVDESLQEQQYELALEQIRALNTYHPPVRARLVEALHASGKHSEVIGIVTNAPLDTLDEREIEHGIWSLCEIGNFILAGEWLQRHAQFQTTSARIFRRAVADRFPDLATRARDSGGNP